MKVSTSGEQRTIALLKAFDNDAYKIINKKMIESGNIVRDEARQKTPGGNALSNYGKWIAKDRGRNLSYNGASVRQGIVTSSSQDTKKFGNNFFFVRISTKSAAGAIIALSGSRRERATRGQTYSGISFVDTLNREHGKEYPRGLLSAIKKKQDVARPLIEAAMNEATIAANRAINR